MTNEDLIAVECWRRYDLEEAYPDVGPGWNDPAWHINEAANYLEIDNYDRKKVLQSISVIESTRLK